MLRVTAASTRCKSTSLVLKRFQSSSKKNLNINIMNPVLPKIRSTAPSTNGNNKTSLPQKPITDETLQNKKIEVKAKKGFSSLPKVPSTYNFNPKELLLDSFFNGYRPMTLPISPPKKPLTAPRLPASLNKPGGAFVYFEIDDNLDFIDDFKDEHLDPNMNHTIQDIERQTSTRFDHSHKSLREEDIKKEEYERELYDNKLELAKEEDLTGEETPSHIVESKRFRGRRKLQYKRRSGKK